MEVEGAAAPAPVMDLSNSDVVTKYKTASDITNKTLAGILIYAKPGMKALDVCSFGDSLITQQCAAVYKTKKIEKGLSFPTSVSINDVVCHYSPLASDESMILNEGDVVKVDVGCHVDGFIAVAAHTFVVRGTATGPVVGRAADVIKAAYLGAEAAVKLIAPGATNVAITETLKQVGEDFDVRPLQGVLMHELKQFVIDGNNVVIQKEEIEQKVDKFEFEKAKVYTVDVVMSTGEGKPIIRDARTTIFKRAVDQEYRLKMKASRYVFSEVNKRFATFPFSLRHLEDEKQARMGVVECCKHDLFHTYPVLQEKPGDLVAHFKFTVLLLPSGTTKVTGVPVNLEEFQSDKVVSAAVQEVLARSTKTKKKKKNKKKATEGAAAAMETE